MVVVGGWVWLRDCRFRVWLFLFLFLFLFCLLFVFSVCFFCSFVFFFFFFALCSFSMVVEPLSCCLSAWPCGRSGSSWFLFFSCSFLGAFVFPPSTLYNKQAKKKEERPQKNTNKNNQTNQQKHTNTHTHKKQRDAALFHRWSDVGRTF